MPFCHGPAADVAEDSGDQLLEDISKVTRVLGITYFCYRFWGVGYLNDYQSPQFISQSPRVTCGRWLPSTGAARIATRSIKIQPITRVLAVPFGCPVLCSIYVPIGQEWAGTMGYNVGNRKPLSAAMTSRIVDLGPVA